MKETSRNIKSLMV